MSERGFHDADYQDTVLGWGYGPAVSFEDDMREENRANGGGGRGSSPMNLPRSGSVGRSGPGPMNQRR